LTFKIRASAKELETQSGNSLENCSTLAHKKSPLALNASGLVVVEKSGNTYFRTGGHHQHP
jgi:hypothetical protein